MAQMLTNLIQAESAGFALGVSARRAQRGEVVVTIDDDRVVEFCSAASVGGADQRMQCVRGRAISARELLDERANA